MKADLTIAGTESAGLAPKPAAVAVRLGGAWLLTVAGLPYTWGRSFVGWQLTGRPETRFAVALVIVITAIVVLTYRLGAMMPRRQRWLIGSLVAASWSVVNVLMFALRVESSMPRELLIAAYLPGSLLVPWTAWMFFGPWGWPARLSVAAPLVALLLGFVVVFRVEGLSGSSNAMFSWRRAPASTDRADFSHAGPKENESSDQSIAENPDRDFPQFLGPDRTAMLANVRLARDWTQSPPLELWRRPIGGGWSSFAVVGDYTFTQEQRGERECVVCYRLLTGEEVWVHFEPVNFTSSLGGPGPRATPTVSRSRVFAIGATGVLNCLDALSGRRVWSVDILKDNGAENISHGVCASPLAVDDWVIVCPTGSGGPSLAAYERETGKRVWAGGTHGASYASPLLAELGGERQFLLFNHAGLTGHDRATGEPLWHFPWTNSVNVNVSQPIVHAAGENHIFISTGYDKGCALIRVDHSAAGTWAVEETWSNNRLKTKFCSAIAYGDHAYGLDDGILACVELATGKRTWKGGRYGHGQILLAGDLLLVQAEQGDVVLVELHPRELRELGRIKALSGKTWNNPALAGPYLLVRNDREAACYELPLTDELPDSQSSEAAEQVQNSP
jgi:outer membrane protein assembly factor BamB